MSKNLEQSWHVRGRRFFNSNNYSARRESDDEQAEKCPDGILGDIEKCPEGCPECANRERVGEGDIPMTRAGKAGRRPFDLIKVLQEGKGKAELWADPMKGDPSRGNFKFRGPRAGQLPAHPEESQEASVAGAAGARGELDKAGERWS